jgi:uracil-DNA glycosylase
MSSGCNEVEDRIRMESSWKAVLKHELCKERMQTLREFLLAEKKSGKTIYPASDEIFSAFKHTPFDRVKVVILGQDPYHGPNQAHGLCFSVPHGIRPPPSLMNIYKELKSDLNITPPVHGNLQTWAEQGVLLLNSVLTVEKDKAASHQKKGWEEFTDFAIRALNESREHLVFILWGSYAQKKGFFIDQKKHCVLESVHPSPLSSHRGFFGSKPFSKTNAYLESKSLNPIDWKLPPNLQS